MSASADGSAAAGPTSVTPADLSGEPSYRVGRDIGIYLWREGGTFHLQWTGDTKETDDLNVVEFEVTTDGSLTITGRDSWDYADFILEEATSRIHGKASVAGGADGLTLTATNATEVTFDLGLSEDISNGEWQSISDYETFVKNKPTTRRPDLVFLGSDKSNPDELPLTVVLGEQLGIVWETAADWDSTVNESGVVHEAVANTDHVDAGVVKQGYSVANPYEPVPLSWFYPLQEDSGTTAYDFGGGNYHATYVGPSLNADGLLSTSAISLDGTSDYVDLPVEFARDRTLSVWVNAPSQSNNFPVVISNRLHDDADSRTHDIPYSAITLPAHTGRGVYRHWTGSTGYNVDLGPVLGEGWVHLVGVSDGNEHYGYRNGTLIDSRTYSRPNPESGNAIIGVDRRFANWNYLEGSVADVRMYDPMTETEIRELYDLGPGQPGTITTAPKEAP